ncbi:MAG: hypothetical protein P1P81_07150, partial [Desulfobulbales bacterium]|nr:hypothetical protein [Desulfobulbales bacterium]
QTDKAELSSLSARMKLMSCGYKMKSPTKPLRIQETFLLPFGYPEGETAVPQRWQNQRNKEKNEIQSHGRVGGDHPGLFPPDRPARLPTIIPAVRQPESGNFWIMDISARRDIAAHSSTCESKNETQLSLHLY